MAPTAARLGVSKTVCSWSNPKGDREHRGILTQPVDLSKCRGRGPVKLTEKIGSPRRENNGFSGYISDGWRAALWRCPPGITAMSLPAMIDAATFSVVERLRDGRPVEIRALKPGDRAAFVAAVEQTSAPSLRRRFFAPRRDFSEQEVAYYLNVDFVDHVALIAVTEEDGRPVIIGGGRYIVERPGQAELAFVVIDRYQGQGVGSALMRHLAAIARNAALDHLIAQVLPENAAMLRVFKKSGFAITGRDPGVVYLALPLS
jgi:RimJ/RimL family protein N-acetyltransferase